MELMEVDLSGLSDEELAALKQLLRKALGAATVTAEERGEAFLVDHRAGLTSG